MAVWMKAGEQDLLCIRRPARIEDVKRGGGGQLHAITSVAIGLPENPFWIGNVSHRVPVRRKRHELGRNPAKEGLRAACLQIDSRELAPQFGPVGKDSFSV